MSELDDLEAYVFEPPEIESKQQLGGRIGMRKSKARRSEQMSANATRHHWLARGRTVPSMPQFKCLRD